MKKHLNLLTLFAAMLSVVAFSACSNEENEQEGSPKGKQVTIRVSLDDNASRTAIVNDNGTLKTQWASGDRLSIKCNNVSQEFDLVSGAGTSTAVFSGYDPRGEGSSASYTITYPAEAADYATPAAFLASKTQTQTGNDSYAHLGACDMLQATTSSLTGSGVQFSHQFAILKLTVPAIPNTSDCPTKVTLNGAWGSDSYTLNLNNITLVNNKATAYMLVPAGTMNANGKLTMSVTGSKNGTYTMTGCTANKAYSAGSAYSFDFSSTTGDVAWVEDAETDPAEIGYTVLFDGSSYAQDLQQTYGNYNNGYFTTYRIPGLACSEDGKTLVAVCDERITGWQDIAQSTGYSYFFGGFTKIHVVYRVSTDGGNTWGSKQTLAAALQDYNTYSGYSYYVSYGDPAICYNKVTKEFVVVCVKTWSTSNSYYYPARRHSIVSFVSTDAVNWTETDISAAIYGNSTTTDTSKSGFATSGGMAVMDDGRVGFVMCLNDNGTAKRPVVIGTSNGNGTYTWTPNSYPVTTTTFGGTFPDESKFVELSDKSWLMSCRTSGSRLFAKSNTAHNSWTKQTINVATGNTDSGQGAGSTLIDAGCNGDLLLVNRGTGQAPWLVQSLANKHYSADPYCRTHVSMYISKDNGANWNFWMEPISNDCKTASKKTQSSWTLTSLSAYSSMCQISKNVVGILVEEDWDSRPNTNGATNTHTGEYSIVFSTHNLKNQ